MSEIKRLVLGVLPSNHCNLKCEYCYISQVEDWGELQPWSYSIEHMVRCLSIERLGGVSLINLTANGETLLQHDVVKLVRALLEEGHFVEIVTNGTVKAHIKELLSFPEMLLERLFFKVSFHYQELKRLNILDSFFETINAIKKSPASFTLELMAYDHIEGEIDYMCKLTQEKVGAIMHATIGRNDRRKDKALLSQHSKEEYAERWKKVDSPMMDFKLEMLGVKRKEFCYAGAWSFFVNMYTGEAQPCYWQPYNQNIFKNPNNPIKFNPVGCNCTQPYCINAHPHLTWGLIPELSTPTYLQMRTRIDENGEGWIKPTCATFFESKLSSSNREYTTLQKRCYRVIYPANFIIGVFRDFKSSITRILKYIKREKR